ncbi:T9SS type A sorting domain-containing protein [Fulvivirgaceae bacterium PWU4]|uniref:T9SS type A sorting domain-containing protein n=1 Tax=Chryseosolibacter histidini TaxID=2782349 RepID=A0AAP2GP73_9BACT|nr:T9SS type A sorting domain-containing protein [Chryseosolibacter histidini]MBT1698783.1 T9SS type A sorting domain-containing protein [Chryseosolibacter histidini]
MTQSIQEMPCGSIAYWRLPTAYYFAFVLLLSAFSGAAQHYDLSSTSALFVPLTSATAVDAIEADNAISAAIPIGFSFDYYGASYTELKASSDGFISFNASASNPSENTIGQSAALRIIAPLWDDLSGTGGQASYKTEGVSPDRVFTFEWLNWKWNFNATAGISFQVRLHESGNIEFSYRQETGALNFASASIGIVGNNTDQFYSLADATAAPALSINGSDDISIKPATDQVYTFTVVPAAVAPTTPASDIVPSSVTGSSMMLSWTNGGGLNRAVFMKRTTSVSETAPVVNGQHYPSEAVFGAQASEVGASDWFCVYNGSGSSFTVSGLQSGFTYRVHVVEYNGLGGAQQYLTASAIANPSNFSPALVTPGAPESTVSVSNLTSSSVTFRHHDGDGTHVAIFMREAGSGTAPATDNTTYTANTTFGTGSQAGTSGWYCVYNAEASSSSAVTTIQVTGLSPNTTYRIHAVDYNGAPGSEKYRLNAVTDNPVQFTTYAAFATPPYTLAASADVFVPLTSATAADAIEADDQISGSIPIGFTFHHGGIPFTHVKVSSNGFLSFNTYAQDAKGNNLSTGSVRPALAPLWDDLSGIGGQASYKTEGVAPDRTFTFEWLNWKWGFGASSAVISFQAKLYEADNSIEYSYQTTGTSPVTPSASFGMAFPSTGSGNFLSLNNSGASPSVSTTVETQTIAALPADGQHYRFTPSKILQSITFNALQGKTVGDAPYALTATASSGLPVSYSSSNSSVATVSGNTMTIVGQGSTMITASQAGDKDFAAADPVQQTLVVKLDQSISFTLPVKTFNDPAFTLPATASSGLSISYTSDDESVATVSGNTVTIVGAGTADITGTQAGDNAYNAAPDVTHTLTVNKDGQTISFVQPAAVRFADPAFDLEASADSGLGVSFASANPGVATISGNTVTIVGVGTTDITASQAGNVHYNAATPVIRTLTVNKADQSITFDALPLKLSVDVPFDLPLKASSGLAIQYASSNTAVATVSGNTVTIKGIGTTDITASQPGDAGYNAATPVLRQLTVKLGQVITFAALQPVRYADQPFAAGATSSSGLAISYTSSNPEVATVSGGQITIVAPGSTVITALQAGNATYAAANSVVQTLIVNRGLQQISFSAINDVTLGNAQVQMTGTSTSLLPVIFSAASDKVAINGNTLTFLRSGPVTVQASQAGNFYYEPAPVVERTFCIHPPKPAVVVTDLETETPVITSNAEAGNQWYKEGVAIDGANAQAYTVTTPGMYTVIVSAGNCASLPSDPEAFVITGAENVTDGIAVYPNPAESELVIDVSAWHSPEGVSVALYDAAGRTLLKETASGKTSLKIGSYRAGSYVLKISNGKRAITRQIIKK